ncbi:cellulose biosynthesis protein BcsS [Nitratireductor sp. XY-223]|uniref:cellulose biosynthesis protein BcsS n=1 Tax=Nitratireductor sp. XY-223 TaxID=2561926 RepID=UPI0010A9BDBE|nr:cellulose biosynthesis protein BcsS [Nitratireductor sp. XY-223]
MREFSEINMRTIMLKAGAIALLLPTAALAADATAFVEINESPVNDTVVYWGADFAHKSDGNNGYGAGAGFVTALNGDIGATGWTLTGNIGGSRTEDVNSDTNSFYSSALVGYQWHAPGYYITVAGGVNYVNNDETPPGGVTDGGEVGAIAQYGFETKMVDAFYVQSYGAYSTAFDQKYVHAKVGYKTPVLRFGPEFTFFDESTSQETLRFGGFVGDISVTDSVNMVVSAGYQHELEPGVEDGFYATIGFSVPLSLR